MCYISSIPCGVGRLQLAEKTKYRGRVRGSRASPEKSDVDTAVSAYKCFLMLHYIFLISVGHCASLCKQV